jgi:hypothetical protein
MLWFATVTPKQDQAQRNINRGVNVKYKTRKINFSRLTVVLNFGDVFPLNISEYPVGTDDTKGSYVRIVS